ncbi:hypothetical protein Patl1_26391 [Pistacia atlantica]|uniref:Uncharacterized protein n=1 Tax=Pistacia atlantica TaxID=434234 RepID=A0ACC1B3L6_9ROSI|nr:hypothetical protein Patl1_26391 [Pistacia atlantica]
MLERLGSDQNLFLENYWLKLRKPLFLSLKFNSYHEGRARPCNSSRGDVEPATTAKQKNKKRKRDKPPSLTTMAQKAERVTAKVERIPDQPNKTPPLVGYFPYVFSPQSGE